MHDYPWQDLHLSQSEAEEDVNTWFQHCKGGGLEDCLQDTGLWSTIL